MLQRAIHPAKLVLSWIPVAAISIGVLLANGCVPKAMDTQNSAVKTTDIAHSSVKWQSIGNCWLYAVAGWTESVSMVNGKAVDFSESYLTYLYFEEQLLRNPNIKELVTGGSWYEGSRLILKYGLMLEGDFIPSEANQACSLTQGKALATINKALASGEVRANPSPAKIRALLDSAFGVKMSSLKSKIINPASIRLVSVNGSRPAPNLQEELNRWDGEQWYNDQVYSVPQGVPAGPLALNAEHKALLKRVMRAMNDHKPVLITWFVDFNAASNGIFSLETLVKAGKPGRQGGHITVLEDYVAHGVDPQTGKRFQTTEGENSPELKRLAAEYGSIDYFVVKNSWGGADRPDRPSYMHDNELGFTRLNANYIFGSIPVAPTETSRPRNTSVLNEFIMPANY